MPARAATYNYVTDFQVFDTSTQTPQQVPIFSVTGTISYNGPATFSSTLQDLSLDDANSFLTYDWDIDSIVGFVGNFTNANSFWNSFSNPPNPGPFPVPFEISQDQIVLKALLEGQEVQLFTNTQPFSGITIEGSTNGISYVLGGEGTPVPVPTPGLLPGLLGFGATLVRRKKQQDKAAA